jgi:hypothetical protein
MLRGLEVVVNTMDQTRTWRECADDDRRDLTAFGTAVQAEVGAIDARVAALRAGGKHTEDGIREQVAPMVAALATRIEAFERETTMRAGNIAAAREAIAAGRRVRQADGHLVDLPAPPEPTAVEELRHAEIRAGLRALDAATRRDAILAAVRDGDDELVRAVERAPRAFALLDELTRRLVGDIRMERAGAKAPLDLGDEVVVLRAQLGTKARSVVDALRVERT